MGYMIYPIFKRRIYISYVNQSLNKCSGEEKNIKTKKLLEHKIYFILYELCEDNYDY